MAMTSKDNTGMLTGLFSDRDSAERAYQSLSGRGYTKDDINVVMSDDTRKRSFSQGTAQTELGTKAAEGAGVGGAVGGTLGAIIAAVTATGTSLVVPGMGLVIAGPLAAAAAGAGAGAATGGLVGALIGWNIPEERVKRYESGIKQGGILMGVKPRSREDADYIEQQWRGNNVQDVYNPVGTSMEQGAAYSDNTVVGVYDNYADAQDALQALAADGFQRSNMRLTPEFSSGETTTAQTSEQSGSGIGHFFRSLFGMDEQKEHRDVYAESVRRGSFVLAVDTRSDDEADRAADIMLRYNAIDIDERSSQWKQQGWTGYDESAQPYTADQIQQERSSYAQARTSGATTEQSRIPVIEEELKVGKRQVQRGGIRVFQRIRETPVHESVELREEHVKVERHPVDKPATEADIAAAREGTVELRETAEEAVVSKTARVVEEVVVGKEVTERTEQIDDTVRKTDVQVEQLGAGASYDDEYRRHWQTTYGASGGRYEDYDDAYRYGTTMAGSDRFRNTQWQDAEPQLRSDWESSHPGGVWDKVKDAVRYGAERVTGRRH